MELIFWSFLLSFAYYPYYFGFLAWFALVRPFMIISKLKGREAFNAAYFFGFTFNLFSLYWVVLTTIPGTVGAILIVACYYAVMLLIFNKVYRIKPLYGYILLPFLWVGLEYFRTLTQFAFPWSDLGYTQAYYLYVLQIVSVISVHGLSFIIVTVNVLLWQVLRKELTPERRLTSFFISLAIVALVTAYGWIVTPKYPVPGNIDVALLQGSVPLDVKWEPGNEAYSFNRYDSLAMTVADSGALLYVWPETSAPCYMTHDYSCRAAVANIARKTHAYHLVGALSADRQRENQHHYNSCFQFDPEGRIDQRYDKVKLVPFSEQVPYQESLPFLKRETLEKYLSFIQTSEVQWWSDFKPGDSIKLFQLPEIKYGVLICFESTFPEYSRKMIMKGADFLVGITNDTWFKNSVGIYMHERIFATRAVENRTWAVRVANSGISYIIDDYGRLRKRIGYNEITAVTGKINPIEGRSVFNEYGDFIGLSSFLILISIIAILIISWFLRKIFYRLPHAVD